ncbi:PAP2 superfamily protein [Legionella massiliensis]|uniref:PAP2 superfamily protein n=1 Tax=Legionella massiliensis TaxID=1034943 RepID=A0A078KV56_9GAMM|nr:vanadium-dependent haloperoxidase [Legionella massiliensis]CDZ78320.1 PAP2 superfamily protein [Legionella massiliensis]CEE14058.1 PAP2 superfamily protein [Legionella massiliensis]
MRNPGITLSVLLVIFVASIFYYSYRHTLKTEFPTYFQYSEGAEGSLASLNSKQSMTKGLLKKWDSIMFDLIKSNKVGDASASRIYAYVYTSQRDAAFLSYNIKHQFMGSFDQVSAGVLCLFFVNDCEKIKLQIKEDVYSEQLATLVLAKVKERRELDKKQEHLATELSGSDYWAGVRPYYGQEVGSWMPWAINSTKDFLAAKPPAPNSPAWQRQLQDTENALHHISAKQTKGVVSWAGNPSTITPPGIWLKFSNDYIESEQIPLAQVLFVRSVLAMGMADAAIAVFYSKYVYWVKRPFMLNPKLHTIMPTPNHPSYPAGHSTISAAAAAILSYYFPQNKQVWWNKAQEASSSRVWGGIHFPIDTEEGLNLGEKIGNAVIQAQPQSIMS